VAAETAEAGTSVPAAAAAGARDEVKEAAVATASSIARSIIDAEEEDDAAMVGIKGLSIIMTAEAEASPEEEDAEGSRGGSGDGLVEGLPSPSPSPARGGVTGVRGKMDGTARGISGRGRGKAAGEGGIEAEEAERMSCCSIFIGDATAGTAATGSDESDTDDSADVLRWPREGSGGRDGRPAMLLRDPRGGDGALSSGRLRRGLRGEMARASLEDALSSERSPDPPPAPPDSLTKDANDCRRSWVCFWGNDDSKECNDDEALASGCIKSSGEGEGASEGE
jgi:hypothetical protein